MGAKEVAIQACKSECKKQDVVLLDESVAVRKTRFGRTPDGRFCFLRHFQFEFTNEVSARYQGTVILCGRDIRDVDLGVYRTVE